MIEISKKYQLGCTIDLYFTLSCFKDFIDSEKCPEQLRNKYQKLYKQTYWLKTTAYILVFLAIAIPVIWFSFS